MRINRAVTVQASQTSASAAKIITSVERFRMERNCSTFSPLSGLEVEPCAWTPARAAKVVLSGGSEGSPEDHVAVPTVHCGIVQDTP